MVYAVKTYLNMVKKLEVNPSLGFITQCVFQGLSAEQFRQAATNGGNVLGFEDRSENLVLFLGIIAYKNAKFIKLINAKITTWVDNTKRFSVENGTDDEYFFLNYADLWAAMERKTLRLWRRLRANTTRTEYFNEACPVDLSYQMLEQLHV
ncbi:hypothetical protein PoMZ_13481 [Pyricularia oryzae]|uniref:Uncharacterized protein n=1 Tax=Pyricularia oryzae TaxID=318829 RepID=A0A4P7NVL8_PYROR|nr:hypothetical protein PoMZ_13481 [Pyricularia oryzae]